MTPIGNIRAVSEEVSGLRGQVADVCDQLCDDLRLQLAALNAVGIDVTATVHLSSAAESIELCRTTLEEISYAVERCSSSLSSYAGRL